MTTRKVLATIIHAFIGWVLCAATMGIGMATTSLRNALVIHAIAAPTILVALSLSYFKRPGNFSPLVGAIAFVVFVIAVDFFIVALVINRSLDMFTSLLGTWVPFTLIFASTYVTGLAKTRGGRVSNCESAL